MNPNAYKVIKLISGENIICEIVSKNNDIYEIINPLLIYVRPSVIDGSMSESLMLTRWVQPFTEEETFEINKTHMIVMLTSSPGLSLYYENIIKKYGNCEEIKNVDLYEDQNEEEIYEELLEELKTDSKSIH